jgi:Ca2+-binding RTX toxin-like protein
VEDAGAPSGAVGTLVSTLVDFVGGGGQDNVTDSDPGAVTGIALITTDAANGSWHFSTDNGGTWNPVGAVSDAAAVLLAADASTRIYFQPNANFNGSLRDAITFRAWDQSSGSNGSTADASANGGDTAFSGELDTASLTVAAVNDAPLLDATKNPVLDVQSQDAGSPVGAVGTLVSNLVDLSGGGGLDNVTEIDAGVSTGIALTGADITQGSWHFSTNNGTSWTSVGAVSDATALLLAANASTRLYFEPSTGFNGTLASAITFRAWDQSTGSNGGTADVVGNGGTSAFSAMTDTASIVVDSPENQSPVLDATKDPVLDAVNEDVGPPVGAVGTLVSTLVDLPGSAGLDNVTDADVGAVTGIAVTGTNSNGTWYFSTDGGASWTNVGDVSDESALLLAADSSTRLYLQPNENIFGLLEDAITFRAWDQSLGTNGDTADTTANGGTTPFSADLDTAAITIDEVNDAPVLDDTKSPVLGVQTEGAGAPVGPVGTTIKLVVDVVDGGGLDNVSDDSMGTGIALTGTDATNGTWYFTINEGASWTPVGAVSDGAARLLFASSSSQLYFQPNTGFSGTIPTAITFRAWDLTSGSNGGIANTTVNGGTTAFSTATDTASIIVDDAENHAPVLDSTKTPVLEGLFEDGGAPVDAVGTLVSSLIDFVDGDGLDNVTDDDAIAATGIALTGTDTANGTWHFSMDDGATWQGVGAVSDSQARLLTADAATRLYFEPNANFNGTVSNAISFRAWDRTSGSNGDTANVTASGGLTAFSTEIDTARLDVFALRDDPVLDATKSPVLGAEDQNAGAPVGAVGSLISTLVDLTGGGGLDNVSDPDAGAVTGLALTALDTTHGSWYFSINNGSTWNAVGAVSSNQPRILAANANTRLYFEPDGVFSGTIADAITFRAWDQTSFFNGELRVGVGPSSPSLSTASDTASITINAPAGGAKNDAFTTTENAVLSGKNVFGDNGSGADSAAGPLTVTAVNGNTANVGALVTLASGARVTLNANGILSYDPNHVFDFLPAAASGAANTTALDSFTYTLNGASNATVTLTVNGVDSNDTVLGTAGSDTLNAGIGNDKVDGLAGADKMSGGKGDDTFTVDDPGDTVVENLGEGTDLVQSVITRTLETNVENLTLIGSNVVDGTGNDLNNVLHGNGANNTLTGGSGLDTLRGFGGTDKMVGGKGDDLYSVHDTTDVIVENVGEGFDQVWSTVTYTLDPNVENLTLLGTVAINATGNALNNSLFGNDGANTIDGSVGGDKMTGGKADDTYIVDNAGDVVIELGSGGIDTVLSSITRTLEFEVENLTLTGASKIDGTGNARPNVLHGNSADNTLSGGANNDTLRGFGGTDKMVGGTGDDLYSVHDTTDSIVELAGEGFDQVWSTVTYTLDPNVENLTLLGTLAVDATGNGLTNGLFGNSANNVITGAGGADKMTGAGGADRFDYNAMTEGGDTIADFTKGSGGDILDFSGIVVGFNPGTSNVSNFVKLQQSGGNTIVSVNADGIGTDFVAMATLLTVTGLVLNDMAAQGNLVLS